MGVVILHNIRSAHNVGSIFRTADGAGFSKVYLSGFSPAPLNKYGIKNSKISKVSLGAEDFLEWESVEDILDLISRLKGDGYSVFAVEQSDDSVKYDSVEFEGDFALIMGSETEGLPGEVLETCDKVLEIPMNGEKTSLNVAVAFGIVAYGLK